MIKKQELIERLKNGETLREYFRDGNCNGFYIGNESVHGLGASQLVNSGKLEQTENSGKTSMGREWQWKSEAPAIGKQAPQLEETAQKRETIDNLSQKLFAAGWEYFDVSRNWKSPDGLYFLASQSVSAYAYQLKLEQIAKLQADLAAAQAIIVEAGKQVESLKMQVRKYAQMNIKLTQENVDLKNSIEDARQAMSNQTHGGAQYQPDILLADSILAEALQAKQPPSQDTPQEETGVTLSEDARI